MWGISRSAPREQRVELLAHRLLPRGHLLVAGGCLADRAQERPVALEDGDRRLDRLADGRRGRRRAEPRRGAR